MSLLSIIRYIALRWNYLLKKVGILSVYILMILTIIRGCFPLDIYKPGLTKTYESLVIIPAIQKIIMTPVTYENHHSFSVLDLIIILIYQKIRWVLSLKTKNFSNAQIIIK